MADDPYDNLDLQQIDNATYATIEPKKEEDLQKILQSDIRRYGRVGVGVGLLCALLNIAVPLYLYQSNMVERKQQLSSYLEREQLQTRVNKLTEEQDDMRFRLCVLLTEPDRFTYGDGLCYYISTEKKNWTESRQWCRDRQSDLIVIKSKEKQDFVERLNQTAWLGLTDQDVEDRFKWVDGAPLTTPRFWGSGQPDDDLKKEDCVEFYDGSSRAVTREIVGGWNDLPCSFLNYWICEKNLC